MMISDIGDRTIAEFSEAVAEAKTILVNGPPGIYENPMFEKGTKTLWNAVADSGGFSVVGGGDSVTSFTKYVDMSKLNYVSTAGGALIRYLSGIELPLIAAMNRHA
jgi:phosphoglycerate kinase